MISKTRIEQLRATPRFGLSRSLETVINLSVPEGKAYLPFQEAGIEFALLGRNTLFADPPGLGKTIQTIGYMNEKGIERALVVCPASLVYNWKKEIESWHLGKPRVEVFNPKKFRKGAADVLVFSYGHASLINNVRTVLDDFNYEHIAIDESHYLKEPKSKRTKHVLAKNGLIAKASSVHALSGTPIVNRPIELYPVIKAICPEAIDGMDYFTYGLRFCGGFKGDWGWDFSGASNLKELGTRLRASVMIRRDKRLAIGGTKLPPNVVFLAQSKSAGELVKRMAPFDEKLVVSNITASFEELSELRRELGIEKIAPAAEYIQTQLESGHEKIVLFAHHKEVIRGLKEKLAQFGVAVVVGDTTKPQRQAAVDRFQRDPNCRLILGSLGALSVGHTLTAASYVIFVEFSWVPGENEQATDRVDRIGQTEFVQSDFLTFEDSLDERVLKVNLKKQKVIKEVFE